MPDFTVVQRGVDTSGRKLLATRYMWAWWDAVCADLGFEPTIVQGAFMAQAGGGADASAGYHDRGGCFDLRVWDRTPDQVEAIIRTTRRRGAGSWVRDERHGMDPHIHLVLGSDRPLATGAATQWGQYLAGRDGLASNGADYHWRPDPIVTTPPEDEMTPEQFKALIDNQEKILRRIDGVMRDKLSRVNTRLARANGLLREAAKTDKNVADALDEILAALEDSEGDGSPRA